MKAFGSASKFSFSTLFTLAGLALATVACRTVLAQDSAFLACERHADRERRVACLEEALAAVRAQSARPPAAASSAPVAETAIPEASQPLASPLGAAPAEDESNASLSDRTHGFGRREVARVGTDTRGREHLEDTIARLEKRNGLWIVTLSSGQVWKQELPRALNLREGDHITIYQAGFGSGYRLSAERISGFIRVERVR